MKRSRVMAIVGRMAVRAATRVVVCIVAAAVLAWAGGGAPKAAAGGAPAPASSAAGSPPAGPADPVTLSKVTVNISTGKIGANVVRVDLSGSGVRVAVGLAARGVGAVEELASIASRHGAVAAINGTFFNAYDKGPTQDPVGALITGGVMVHKGGTGTVLGISRSGDVRMDAVRFKIAGGTNGSWTWPNNWYAHHMNRAATGANTAVLYTPAWSGEAGGDGGTCVVVSRGVVTAITSEKCRVPDDGFVLYVRGSETSLLQRFAIGTPAQWRVEFADGRQLDGFWASVTEALGAGPRLVKDGKVVYTEASARDEGFTDPKILTNSSARSAVGITSGGELLLVTVASAKMLQLAEVMQQLGAVDAMNLDGGASSGLVFNGAYVTRPGRPLSNALVVVVDG